MAATAAPPSAPTPPAVPAAPATAPAPARVADTAPEGVCRVALTGWTLTRPAETKTDDAVAVIVGKLLYSQFTVECENAPAGKVLRAATAALDVNSASRFDSVFDAKTPVTLSLKDATGKQLLETVIGQMSSDSTWQITDGMLEIGRRSYLARANARVTRVYPIGDLTLEAPYFKSFLGSGEATKRRTPMELASEFMFQIYTTLEPTVWQPEPPSDEAPAQPGQSGPAPASKPSGDQSKPANFDHHAGPLFVRGCWAQMAYRNANGVLVVTAPDFVHRAIAGYPKPLPPAVSSAAAGATVGKAALPATNARK